MVWGELETKNCFQRQSFTKYLRQTLFFMWNSTIREKFSFYFSRVFGKHWKKFHEGLALVYNSSTFWDFFSEFSLFPKILSVKSFDNSKVNMSIPCLSLIIVLPLTYGERKVWQNIKMCQNVKMIVVRSLSML